MPARFEAFVLLAAMRTGSNFLEANLRSLPGVTCHGELFNPHFLGSKDRTALLGFDLAARDRDPLALLARVIAMGPGLVGFRFFHDHDRRVLDHLLPDPRVAKIILIRNPLDSYVSWKIAQSTGQWKLTNPVALRRARATFDAEEFSGWLKAQEDFQRHLRRGLQVTGQTAFRIGYDDLSDVAVLNGLARFLGVDPVLETLDTTLKRQNPEHVLDKVTNPVEMEAALARLDPFDLAHPQEFEPRRTAAIPGYLLAQGTPLVFLPIPGGPDAAVADWLSRIGTGGVISGMTHRDMRSWKLAHPGHRSLAVLRHPLERAHSVFCNRVLAGKLPDLRQRLIRVQGLDLPPPGMAADLSPEAHRAAFLGFLRFVKLGLAGQTGLRVDASWASQTAVLQGYATLRPPDLLLRESGLAEGLDRLARDMGLSAPPFRPRPEAAPFDLESFCDTELQQGAREAYARDYLEFGFGDWRASQAA